MSKMLISVIIPVYNREKTIQRAVDSVLRQPCSERIEIILVDDGSKDDSGVICDMLAKKHDNIFSYHKENSGAASARNFAIERAGGKYIIPLDSDDRWDDKVFDKNICTKMEQENIDIYGFGVRFCSPKERLSKEKMPYSNQSELLGIGNTKESEVMHWSLCYKREMILDYGIRYPETKRIADPWFVREACICAKSYYGVRKVLYNYVIDYNNATDDTVVFYESFKGATAFNRWAKNKMPEACLGKSEQLSNIVQFLPRYCALHSYKDTESFFSQPMFSVLNDSDVLPWTRLQKSYDLWKKSKKQFWLRSKLIYMIPCVIKNNRNKGPLKGLKSFIWYHWIKKMF